MVEDEVEKEENQKSRAQKRKIFFLHDLFDFFIEFLYHQVVWAL
jgi:hypothetical protein